LKRQNREIFAKLKEQYARLSEAEQDRNIVAEREHRCFMQVKSASHVLDQVGSFTEISALLGFYRSLYVVY